MDNGSQIALSGCVQSLQNSMQLMESSLNILDSGVADLPRLTKVIQTTKHFELVSEASLKQAQQTLLSSIEPELNSLLERVEAHLDKMARREQSLAAKAELQQGRLTNTTRTRPTPAASANLQAFKLEQLRQKKQRLSYAVDQLELRATQRQRQLRKSMAVSELQDG